MNFCPSPLLAIPNAAGVPCIAPFGCTLFPPNAPKVNPLPIMLFLANTTHTNGCIIKSVGLNPCPNRHIVKSSKSSTDNVSLKFPSLPRPVVPAAGF